MKIYPTIYVNRQNTDRPVDWTLPTKQQKLTWMESVRRNLRKALNGLCEEQRWLDQNELLCD